MVEVEIKYCVYDKKDRQFRDTRDLAVDIEREIWLSPLFCEANEYEIKVTNGDSCSLIKHRDGDDNDNSDQRWYS